MLEKKFFFHKKTLKGEKNVHRVSMTAARFTARVGLVSRYYCRDYSCH